jgi:NAD-reducing hydrogenase large subunit
MVELLHCAETIEKLLNDPDISGDNLQVHGDMQLTGIGVLEAPRGTLFHHYEINEDGLVEKANLIVSTTNNNQAMNESIRQVARTHLNGNELTEPLLNQIEIAIRAYDPCLSCATHAMGKMPLEISLINQNNELIDQLSKSSTGQIRRTSNQSVS